MIPMELLFWIFFGVIFYFIVLVIFQIYMPNSWFWRRQWDNMIIKDRNDEILYQRELAKKHDAVHANSETKQNGGKK